MNKKKIKIKRYFERVSQKINDLSDNEFMELLLESGLRQCPLEEHLLNYFNEIKQLNNFKIAYFLDNEILWIITNNSSFENKKSYFNLLRKYNNPVEIVIWDYKTEILEVKENLKHYNYIIINK